MQIQDLSQPVTSSKLNESLSKKFGYKLKLEQFSDIQLEDVRNKLRTELSQMELSESYDGILESPQYHKTRALLDVINQEILEREIAAADGILETSKPISDKALYAAIQHRAEKMSVPEGWIKNAIKRMKLGESDREELTAELALRYDLNESQASWVLLEGEEQKAENILSTKDMVAKITNWIEDTAAMKADQLLELLDSIRVEQGSAVAQQYNEVVKNALEGLYNALVSTREGLSQGLAIVSGEQSETMGAGAEGLPSEAGSAIPTPTPISADELSSPELGDEAGEAGRMKRESIEYSRKLGMLLSSKKK